MLRGGGEGLHGVPNGIEENCLTSVNKVKLISLYKGK